MAALRSAWNKTVLSLFSVLTVCSASFFSCSLDYGQEVNSESSVPEFIFKNAAFNRYEDNKLSMALESIRLEQYKSDGAMYGQDVSFKTWNQKSELATEGTCGLISINSKTKIYLLFNNIIINSHQQNMQIYADNLKWDGTTEQLTAGATDKVSIKRNDVDIEGRGFSASGVSRSFAFSQPVNGTIQTSSDTTTSTTEAAP